MGDPSLLSAAVTLASWREQRAPHHLSRTLLGSPLSSSICEPHCTPSFLLNTPARPPQAVEALSHANRGEGGEEPRRAASRPKGHRWQRFQPNHHEFGDVYTNLVS